MRVPAEAVVLRHHLTHPSDRPAEFQRHTGVRLDSADRVLKRLQADPNLSGAAAHNATYALLILKRLQERIRRLRRREFTFHLPDPHQWIQRFQGHFLIGGELAAAEADGIPIRPARILAYVTDLDAAAKTALNLFAKLTGASEANLVLREADPWLRADGERPRFVEKGQRMLDAEESPTILLAGAISWRR